MKPLISLFLLLSVSNTWAFFVPDEAYTFEFNVKTVNMSDEKEMKLRHALYVLRRVFMSPDFKRKILRFKFKDEYGFHMNKGLSNREIYETILSGMESLQPDTNNAMDVEIKLYQDMDSTVLGYTNPSTTRIWMNTKYYNKYSPADLAGHLTHEWLHKLGFDHERRRSEDRQYSVPYAVGYIVRDIAEQIEQEENENSYLDKPL